jgi:transporter family protein
MTSTILLVLTAVLWGSSPILEKIGLGKTDPLTAISIRIFAVAAVLLFFLLFTGKLKEVAGADAKTIIIFSLSGLLAGLLGMITYFGALKIGATSRVVPIAATYPLVTAVLSVLILKEGVTIERIIGTILIVTGIWFVR